MLIIDLRWLLLLLILLPLLAIVATLGVLRWIEQRHKTEEILSTLSPVLHAPIGFLMLRPDQNVAYANPYAQRFFNADETKFDLTPEFLTLVEEHDAFQIASAESAGLYRSLETDVTPFADAAKQRVRWWITDWADHRLVFFADATSQKQTEQKFSLMLGRLAHELRTPLETISAHLEVLRLPHVSESQRDESIAYAKGETQRLTQLSNRALELVRIEGRTHIETELFDLALLAQEVVAQLLSKAEAKEIRPRLESPSFLPDVLGNRGMIKQVLTNLISNSIRYSRSGDSVTVILSAEESGVLCKVCDTGSGIAPQHLSRLTEPFFRAASANEQSTGLGLAIVSEILRHHQSQLIVESIHEAEAAPDEQSGTTMRFILPTLAENDR